MRFDVVVIGAGAAGLFCAGVAGPARAEGAADRPRRASSPRRSASPAAAAATSPTATSTRARRRSTSSATTRTSAARRCRATRRSDFIALVQRHGIAFHEKHKGQLFCDGSSRGDHRHAAGANATAGGVTHWQPCTRAATSPRRSGGYRARHRPRRRSQRAARRDRDRRPVDPEDRRHRFRLPDRRASSALRIVAPRPALVPLTFDGDALGAVRAPGRAGAAGRDRDRQQEGAHGPSSKTCCSRTAA